MAPIQFAYSPRLRPPPTDGATVNIPHRPTAVTPPLKQSNQGLKSTLSSPASLQPSADWLSGADQSETTSRPLSTPHIKSGKKMEKLTQYDFFFQFFFCGVVHHLPAPPSLPPPPEWNMIKKKIIEYKGKSRRPGACYWARVTRRGWGWGRRCRAEGADLTCATLKKPPSTPA